MIKKRKKVKLKISRIIFLIVLIASNTFAWFIYASKVDSDVSVHIRAWNIVFEGGDTQLSNTINFDVDSVYPGMTDYSSDITAYNYSEMSASMSFYLLEARILDDTYVTVEGRRENGDTPLVTDLTSAQLISKLANDYPFTITFSTSSGIIDEEDGEETFTLSVVWPYESNNDELDTQWGIAANTYKESNPSSSSIAIKVKVTIIQNLS